MTGPIHPASPKGSVLLVVLCVVALLSFLIVNTAFVTNQHGETQAARLGLMRAHELAEMGVAVAVHPMIKAADPLLRRKVSEIERFEARLTTAESKLNLNKLLAEQQTLVLERVFEAWGLSIADAQGLAAILIDWTDADDVKR
ncbi:MAG: general secretion pathway protein GspK, partial [Burkholderiales bacterium]|nr:general secretion pathway protein GspK [Burkholderiales bacterium]